MHDKSRKKIYILTVRLALLSLNWENFQRSEVRRRRSGNQRAHAKVGDVADRLFGSLQVNSSKARDLLGWEPVVTMDEALRKTAEGYFGE